MESNITNLILAIVETLEAFTGQILYGFIITYMTRKTLYSTFDTICIHNMIFAMVYGLYVNFIYLVAIFLSPLDYLIASVLHAILDISHVTLVSLTLSTLIIKYLFIFKTASVNELSEKSMTKLHLKIAAAWIFLTYFLDQISSTTDGPIFKMLTLDLEMKSLLGFGIGSHSIGLILIIFTLVLNLKINRLNKEDGFQRDQKITVRITLSLISGFAGLCTVIVFFGREISYPALSINVGHFFFDCIPLAMILRNSSLRAFVSKKVGFKKPIDEILHT